MTRTRTLVACLCIGVLVFAAFLPVLSIHFSAILTPLWLVWPAAALTLIRRRAHRCNEQPVSLLSRGPSRAPPTTLAFV